MRALQTFHALGRLTAEGDILEADDEIVVAFPSLFVNDTPVLERPASIDAPLTRPAKKAPARKAAASKAKD